jgi:zinc transporter ZupT
LIAIIVATTLVVRNGDAIVSKFGHVPPTADQFSVRRVDFVDDAIEVHITNPQSQHLSLATVMVDDMIVPYHLEGGSAHLDRLDSRTIEIPFRWVDDEPYTITLTASSGIATEHKVVAAVPRAGVTVQGLLAGAGIGTLVGILPIALGLMWLPLLRRANPSWMAGFMAMTAGLLVFVGLDALIEAANLQATLPGPLAGMGIVLLGATGAFAAISWLSQHMRARANKANDGMGVSPASLAMLIAIGIGLHNLGEGLAIGSSFALGELALGVFLIAGFMIHNVTEGLGIAAPASSDAQVQVSRIALLILVSGAPAIVGIWIGRYITNDLLGALFLSIAVGAAAQVVYEVVRYIRRTAPSGLTSTPIALGFVSGVAVMFVTGILVGG